MLKSQTDWLKTFQQEMSTFNRPTPKSTPSAITPSNSRNLTTLYPFKNSYSLVSYCRKQIFPFDHSYVVFNGSFNTVVCDEV